MPRKKTIDTAACHRLHMLVHSELDELTGMNASDVVRLLIIQAQRHGIKGVTK